jgi:hypothetical protein
MIFYCVADGPIDWAAFEETGLRAFACAVLTLGDFVFCAFAFCPLALCAA